MYILIYILGKKKSIREDKGSKMYVMAVRFVENSMQLNHCVSNTK